MSEPRQLVEQHYRNMNEQTWDREREVLSPDVITVVPGGTHTGIEPFLDFARGFWQGFPDARLEPGLFIEQGNRVVVEGHFVGTHTGSLPMPTGDLPATGRHLNLPYCDVFEIEAGRIVAHRLYEDQMEFAAQLGLLPDPASAQA